MSAYATLAAFHPKVLRDWTRTLLVARDVSETLYELGCRHALMDRTAGYCPGYSKFETACALFLLKSGYSAGQLLARVVEVGAGEGYLKDFHLLVEKSVEYFDAHGSAAQGVNLRKCREIMGK